ncbi:nuclear transport factor 2 family protein [Vibrio kasasachensis]|uniref:nuclear transport factor 2 family protein n=1 Tax=Vibrio kasasachensis TaxID=2910248 RepID=UPI003D0DD078
MITKNRVIEIFSYLETGKPELFFANVSDDVKWEVTGSHPLAGVYSSKQSFIDGTIARLNQVLESKLKLKVLHCFTDGNEAAVELVADSYTKTQVHFNNRYCWVCQFENEKIVNVRAYLDSALVSAVLPQNTEK